MAGRHLSINKMAVSHLCGNPDWDFLLGLDLVNPDKEKTVEKAFSIVLKLSQYTPY